MLCKVFCDVMINFVWKLENVILFSVNACKQNKYPFNLWTINMKYE